jgi:hypothetical protein
MPCTNRKTLANDSQNSLEQKTSKKLLCRAAASGTSTGRTSAMAGTVAVEIFVVHPCRTRTYLIRKSPCFKRTGSRYKTRSIFCTTLGTFDYIIIVKSQFFKSVLAGMTLKII